MKEKQQTIKSPASVTGIGLHTGCEVSMTFMPAPENHGLVFQRMDINGSPLIKAEVENVIDTSRGTTIGNNRAKVHTVEHTLAALTGLGIDNALIQLNAAEPPAMDGSSIHFVDSIKASGIEVQNEAREVFYLNETIVYEEESRGVRLEAIPASSYEAEVNIDFSLDFFAPQKAVLKDIKDFPVHFANARTFCFLHEIEALLHAGLIKGGSLETAVVIVDRELEKEEMDRLLRIFNRDPIKIQRGNTLNAGGFRHINEPARHKLLDLLGDLTLVGTRVIAAFKALRPGHKANVELAKKIKNKLRQSRTT